MRAPFLKIGYAAKKMIQDGTQIPLHLPTFDRWSLGDGKIPSREIRISGWNVNGIRSVIRKNQLTPFIEKMKPDMLCINQTKTDLKAFEKEQWNFPVGYHQYWNFCKISSGYSGVMVLTPHKPLFVFEDIPSEPSHSLEGRVITLQYENFYLVNVYKPNSGNQLARLAYRTQEYDVAFCNYMKKLMSKKEVVIFGDMNVAHKQIDLALPQQNKRNAGFTLPERNAFSDLLNSGFRDTYREQHPMRVQYSWWSNHSKARERNIGWRIDYILTSKGVKIHEAAIHDDVFGSDHCPVSALISI